MAHIAEGTTGRPFLSPTHLPTHFRERLCTLPVVGHLLVALWIYLLVPHTMEDPGLWWHLRNAEIEWRTHAWLTRDLYSFTAAGAPWMDHEWLTEVPFALVPEGLAAP